MKDFFLSPTGDKNVKQQDQIFFFFFFASENFKNYFILQVAAYFPITAKYRSKVTVTNLDLTY